jgi:hypothetical protein
MAQIVNVILSTEDRKRLLALASDRNPRCNAPLECSHIYGRINRWMLNAPLAPPDKQ